VKFLTSLRIIAALLLTLVLVVVLASACDLSIGQDNEADGPQEAAILAPPNNVTVLMGSPIQIQSAHPGGDAISRVELYVSRDGGPEELMRADTPTDGYVVQEWVPQAPGTYTLRARTIFENDAPATDLPLRTIVVADSPALVGGVALARANEVVGPQPTVISATPVASPEPQAQSAGGGDAGVAFVVNSSGAGDQPVEQFPVLHYPPPPPAPGVPPGPTQDEIPPFTAPVCDNAEYLGSFATDTSQRVSVMEDDDIAAKAIAGSTVHRIWQLRNIGTCTWGPGYELAFYGGRAMGAGGVAFEASYPADPGRRNIVIDRNRLIVPEGKPNQIAKLEVLLNLPVTPGIHQSYWRMRNPHGVYFGPVIGVTFEIVRECQFNFYGAPVINYLRIIGIGNVFDPTVDPNDPSQIPTYRAIFEEPITLEWNIINASNFDIVIEDPTGNVETISTPDSTARASFTPKTVGLYGITLYADNGSCTFPARVNLNVLPPQGDQFRLDLILSSASALAASSAEASYSSTLPADQVGIEWEHIDPQVDQVILMVEAQQSNFTESCLGGINDLFGSKILCSEEWSEWRTINQTTLSLRQGADAEAGTATVANLEKQFCPESFGEREQYRLVFQAEARTGGRLADPPESNTVIVECTPKLPTELQP
jgi:hypothetical protein